MKKGDSHTCLCGFARNYENRDFKLITVPKLTADKEQKGALRSTDVKKGLSVGGADTPPQAVCLAGSRHDWLSLNRGNFRRAQLTSNKPRSFVETWGTS